MSCKVHEESNLHSYWNYFCGVPKSSSLQHIHDDSMRFSSSMGAESRNERGGQNLIKRDTTREQGKKKKRERKKRLVLFNLLAYPSWEDETPVIIQDLSVS